MPHRLTLADIMTRDVITLAKDDTLDDARRCMQQGRIRHLPVLSGGRLVGIVSHRDLLAASFSLFTSATDRDERRLFARVTVRELMHDAVSAPPETPVREAGRMLLEGKYGCLPVVDKEGRLLGIVTEADYLKLAVQMLEAIRA